jgi:hypothetical protein
MARYKRRHRHTVRHYGHNPRHHRPYRRHHRRHNPFGVSASVFTDAVYNATGALGSLWLTGFFPALASGWTGVAATGGAAIAMSMVGKMVGGSRASEELLKGGLTATIIKALHQMGVASNLGLGLYAPSWFGVPTSSSQYLQAAQANIGPFRRGAGTIFFPGPGGPMALPAAPGTAIHPAAAAASGVAGMGFHRFRSRYAGNY